ncbi:MAG: NUDIX domain-containing protein [Betaproteobacteria bacterium]
MAIDVAAGVLLDAQGRVLLAQRPQGKVYAGWWEVPGGKFEPGESAHEALARELREELGIVLLGSSAWCRQEYHYAHGHVRLHFRRTWSWLGKPRALEQQQFVWIDPELCRDAIPGPLLPATVPIIDWLSLPARLDAADPRVAHLKLLEWPSAMLCRIQGPPMVWHNPGRRLRTARRCSRRRRHGALHPSTFDRARCVSTGFESAGNPGLGELVFAIGGEGPGGPRRSLTGP